MRVTRYQHTELCILIDRFYIHVHDTCTIYVHYCEIRTFLQEKDLYADLFVAVYVYIGRIRAYVYMYTYLRSGHTHTNTHTFFLSLSLSLLLSLSFSRARALSLSLSLSLSLVCLTSHDSASTSSTNEVLPLVR